MERDTSKDRSGDQAAWRELVARLELPSAVDPASVPWPDRENLHPATAPGETSQPDSGPGKEMPANRGRVIRPASFTRFSEPGPHQAGADQAAADQDAGGQTHADRAAAGPRDFPPGWNPGPLGRPAGEQPAGDDDLDEATRPDLGYLDYDDQETDERYVPPQVPPLPKLDPVARGAWTALFGGPGYLFIATTLGWQVPGWAELAAIVAFVTGFVVLVSRLGDGPSRRDGPDQGAVV